MKKAWFLITFLILGLLTFGGIMSINASDDVFTLTSTELKNNGELPAAQVFKGYGCSGGNVSPQLSWKNAPVNTKSYAIICHDPDAPRANGWYHWLVVDIPLDVNSIKQGEKIKNAKETLTDFGSVGYGGACPPVGHGKHRYNFTVYALNVDKLDVSENTQPKEVENLVLKHAIAKSTITGLYERK